MIWKGKIYVPLEFIPGPVGEMSEGVDRVVDAIAVRCIGLRGGVARCLFVVLAYVFVASPALAGCTRWCPCPGCRFDSCVQVDVDVVGGMLSGDGECDATTDVMVAQARDVGHAFTEWVALCFDRNIFAGRPDYGGRSRTGYSSWLACFSLRYKGS